MCGLMIVKYLGDLTRRSLTFHTDKYVRPYVHASRTITSTNDALKEQQKIMNRTMFALDKITGA